MPKFNHLTILFSLYLTSNACLSKQLNIAVGYGPQVGQYEDVQNNAIVDINYTFWDYYFGGKEQWQVLLGGGYSYLTTDVEINKAVHFYSLLPSIRYNFVPWNKSGMRFIPYLGLTIGPSIKSSEQLGYQKQGSKFIFNDSLTFGVTLGKNNEWDISYSWRHFSNAGVDAANPGFDVPFCLSVGRKF